MKSSSQVRVSLADEFGALLELLFIVTLLRRRLNENTRCWALCLAGFSNLSSTLNIDVLNILLFAENGKVAQHINR